MFKDLRQMATNLSFVDFVRLNLAMSALTSSAMAFHSFIPGKISNAPLFPMAGNNLTKMGDRMLGHAHLLMALVRITSFFDYQNKTVYYLGMATYPLMMALLWSEAWLYETTSLDVNFIGFLSVYLPTMLWVLWRGRSYIQFDQDRRKTRND
ncbi:hypothetical protein PoB_004077500 [Plakobranchus ocellatus]|uniref:Uncharacterized protein n=1 Tax=Plakobranchus ocellatus TaxID=259542 RepID=A0AAV4B3V7_9GAST|nr:hypothetical protein PoB_004077500 [Plakobranchus ocellatus]